MTPTSRPSSTCVLISGGVPQIFLSNSDSKMTDSSFCSAGSYDDNGKQQDRWHYPGLAADNNPAQSQFLEAEELGGFDFLWSSYSSYQDDWLDEEATLPLCTDGPQCFSDFAAMDDVQFDTDVMVLQLVQKRTPAETDPPEKPLQSGISDLPHDKEEEQYSDASHQLQGDDDGFSTDAKRGERANQGGVAAQVLSADQVIRIAGTHYIQMHTHQEGDLSSLGHNSRASFGGYGDQDRENLQLAMFLLAATEMVSNRQYDRASRLLERCQESSCDGSHPVRRVVFYFSRALMERVERETGRAPPSDSASWGGGPVQRVVDSLVNPHPIHLVTHRRLPFPQLMQFTSVQAILDSVASAKRIHLVDLGIKNGSQWSILMHALAVRSGCPVEHLKISAVGASEGAILETGARLASFAENLRLRFDFRAVIVADMGELRGDMFEVGEWGEAVAVYGSLVLSNLLVRPQWLENVVKVVRELKPRVVTYADMELNSNSASFLSRTVDLLFSQCALFDCLEACMGKEDGDRRRLEADFLYSGMRNVVAAEGSERVLRHVGLGVWRAFFARFGLVEAELSRWSLYQASLLLKQFACGHHCTLDMDGKSLMVGWKGTPIHYVSAWKFQNL